MGRPAVYGHHLDVVSDGGKREIKNGMTLLLRYKHGKTHVLFDSSVMLPWSPRCQPPLTTLFPVCPSIMHSPFQL